LDEATSNQVFDLILEIARETGLCALIATHNPKLAAKMDRTLRLQDRRLHQE
jgi:lipoprotein-releasing system ATP-binding protein